MFPSGIAQILTLPKYSLKQQTVIRIPRVFLTLVIPGVQRVLIRGRKLIEEVTCRVLVTPPITLGKVWEKSQSLPLQGITWIRVSEWTESMGQWEQEKPVGRWMHLSDDLEALAIECDEWVGADLHNPIQTTLPPRFAQILNHQGSCDWRVIYVLLMTVDFSGLWHTHKTTLWMQIINLHLTWNACRKYSYSKYSHLSVREGNVNTRLKGNASGFRHWKHLFPHVC